MPNREIHWVCGNGERWVVRRACELWSDALACHGRYAGGVLPDRIDARAPGPSSGRARHGHNRNGRMDCEGEPARVAGCTTKSGGQICGDAVADGEPSFANLRDTSNGFSCFPHFCLFPITWGICFRSKANPSHQNR
jgi:hypothetical protein